MFLYGLSERVVRRIGVILRTTIGMPNIARATQCFEDSKTIRHSVIQCEAIHHKTATEYTETNEEQWKFYIVNFHQNTPIMGEFALPIRTTGRKEWLDIGAIQSNHSTNGEDMLETDSFWPSHSILTIVQCTPPILSRLSLARLHLRERVGGLDARPLFDFD